MPLCFERAADRANATIHHVGRADDVCARLGLRECLLHQRLDRCVIDDHAIDKKSVMAIDIIGVQRHVGHNRNFRHGRFNGAGGAV